MFGSFTTDFPFTFFLGQGDSRLSLIDRFVSSHWWRINGVSRSLEFWCEL